MVTLSETAAKKITDLRLEEGKPEWGLRIRVVGGGCSGMSYELGWDDAPADDDNVVESQGIKVFVDTHSAPYLAGQRDRLRRQQHDGRRVRHQEPERQVVLRVRTLAPVLDPPAAVHEGEVRLFARYREAAGRDRVEIDLPEGGTVETAWEAVARRFPALGQYRPFTLFALREDYVPPITGSARVTSSVSFPR